MKELESVALSTQFSEQKWLSLSKIPIGVSSRAWSKWLSDSGSLTYRFKKISSTGFNVKPLRTEIKRPTLSEAVNLGVLPRHRMYIREVFLCIDDVKVVYARTIIPISTLTGKERKLRSLNNISLGETLFRHKKMRRSSIQIKRGILNNELVWARRSIFYLNEKPLLVSEYFINKKLESLSL